MDVNASPPGIEADTDNGTGLDDLPGRLMMRDRQIAALEAELARIKQQLTDSQRLASELRSELNLVRSAIDAEPQAARDLNHQLQLRIQQVTNDLHAIQSSRGWRFILLARRLRQRLFPRGGRREWFAKKVFGLLRRIWRTVRDRQVKAVNAVGPLRVRSSEHQPASPRRAGVTRLPEAAAAKLAPLQKFAVAARGTVVFPPSVGWSINLFQRPHHLARAMTRDGYAVVFDCSTSYDDVDVIKQIEPGLFLFKGESEWLADLPNLRLWTFSYNYDYRDRYPASTRVIYDWIDDLAVFPRDRRDLDRIHARALREADVVAAVARPLLDEARRDRPDAIYLPNAVESGRFDFAPDPNPALDDDELAPILAIGRPIAGYYGALARWFDYPLLIAAANLRPDWQFVLIGPDYDQSVAGARLARYRNITWLGPRKYHALPGYLHLFDAAMIPFRINAVTKATSPLKLYEYFAAGKPVIATPMPECMAFPEVHIVRDADEFAAALDAARREAADAACVARLRHIAGENTWEARVHAAFAALADSQPRSVAAREAAEAAAAMPGHSGRSEAGISHAMHR